MPFRDLLMAMLIFACYAFAFTGFAVGWLARLPLAGLIGLAFLLAAGALSARLPK